MVRDTVIYTRVSTDEQSNERQVVDLMEKANHYGMNIVQTFSDKISGSKSFEDRDGGSELISFIKSNSNIKDIAISEISRLSRNVEETKKMIRVFSEMGVNIFISNLGMNTLNLDGNINPMVSLVTAVLGGVAEYERELLRERTRSGMRLAKSKGKKIGASKKTESDMLKDNSHIVDMIKSGHSYSEIRKSCKTSNSQISRVKSVLKKLENV